MKIKNILEKNIINKLIESGSKASYGMYLFHHTLIDPIAILVGGVSISSGIILSKGQIGLFILLEIILTFIISWAIVLLINKIPYLSKWSGYH